MLPFILSIKLLLAAATTGLPNAQSTLMPLVIIALMLDLLIVSVWYFLGSVLNNNKIKGAARGELNQLIGTVILVGILIGSLTMISSIFYSAMSTSKLMNPTAISTLCKNISTTSQLDILGNTNSLLTGAKSSTGSFPGICSLVNVSAGSTLTNKLNYPLAATSVLIANLTNQTVANLNSTFTMDAWLGFLSQLKPTIGICIDKPPAAEGCLIPNPIDQPRFDLQLAFAPYAGYDILVNNLSIIGSLLNLSVESFMIQLFLIAIFIYTWPWILFGGLVLRSTMFTRSLGGLLIAVAISGLFIYPVVFSIEYLSLGNGLSTTPTSANPGGFNSTYGFNVITPLPATPSGEWPNAGNTIAGNYVLNFFVEPNIKAISWAYSCWPNEFGYAFTAKFLAIEGIIATSLLQPVYGLTTIFLAGTTNSALLIGEVKDIAQLLVPLTSIISAIKYLTQFAISSTTPAFNLIVYCSPTNALKTFFAILDAYGIIGLISYLIPLMNVVITISSIKGLSELFGGDTSLSGIGKLV